MMTHDFLKDAEARGFESGWFDGLHSCPKQPRPPLGPGLFDVTYLRAFKAAYLDAYDAARKERDRKESLLKTRVHRDAQVKERDDV